MRNLTPIRRCLLQLWVLFAVIVFGCFYFTHSAIGHEMTSSDYSNATCIVIFSGYAIYHYAFHVLPAKEKGNRSRRHIPGVKLRRS